MTRREQVGQPRQPRELARALGDKLFAPVAGRGGPRRPLTRLAMARWPS
jgi:hypothetical protein